MLNSFPVTSMRFDYDKRKVDKFDDGTLFVSTALVYDNPDEMPYETAIRHPSYSNGEHVIVELYPDAVVAQKGHNKWVEMMTQDELPDKLMDVSQNNYVVLFEAFGISDIMAV